MATGGSCPFHLAANRDDHARPFAFMATYSSGFGVAGRLKHLPLREALEQYAGSPAIPEVGETPIRLVGSGDEAARSAHVREDRYRLLM